ncbi:hypothetical protein CVT24_006581, partial [Panaeolus cyanescens]
IPFDHTESKKSRSSTSPSPEPDDAEHPNRPTKLMGSRVPGTTLSSAAYQAPTKIRRIFKNGWNEHVPLTTLTDKYCAKEAEEGDSATESLLRFENGVWTSVNKSLPHEGEIQLSFDEWFQAWNRLLQLIKEHFKYPEYLMWHRHYLRILEDDTRSEDWTLWKSYDITIRRRAVTNKEFDPSKFQERIWQQLSRRQDKVFIVSTIKSAASGLSSGRNNRHTPYTRNPEADNTTLMATSIVTLGTVTPNNALTPLRAPNGTPAPSAVPRDIMPNPAMPSEPSHINFPLPIVTPLIAAAWEDALSRANALAEFSDIPFGIRHGFDMGTTAALPSVSYIPPNHSSATLHPEIILNNIHQELAERRYTGPFHPFRLEALIGPFRTSPLGLVPKSNGQDFRLIQDFSYPRNDPLVSSVNSSIDISSFSCNWGCFQQVVEIILKAPTGSLAATLDVDSAFRRCPIHPSQIRNFVISWEDSCYIDHCAPFGASSSGFIFGRLADAFTTIAHSKGIGPSLNWVDDFLFFLISSSTTHFHGFSPLYSLNDIYELAEALGWPWKVSKTKPFSNAFKYLGFLWNIDQRSVEIPNDKKEKYLAKLKLWTTEARLTRREAENLLGTLIHCTLAIPDGRSRLSALIRFVASFNGTPSIHIRKQPNSSLLNDVAWWSSTLSLSFAGSILCEPPPQSHISFWVDASTSWGIGVIFDDSWDAWQLREGWNHGGRTIGWAEFVAVELGLSLAAARGHHNTHFLIHSDNQGVILAFQKGRSRSAEQNTVLQRINRLLTIHSIWLTFEYVPSASNLADPPSRGETVPDLARSSIDIEIPSDIAHFLITSPR